MKKCPEKFNLYQILDSEKEGKVDPELELHLQGCSACREELEKIRTIEKGLKKQADTVLAGSPVKQRVLQQVSKIKIGPADDKETATEARKPFWFWILAPGILVILVAAISISIGSRKAGAFSLVCTAASNSAFVNQTQLAQGTGIDLTGVNLPVKFSGQFLFTLKKDETRSVFKMKGDASLDSIREDVLEFKGRDAAFKLVEGPAVRMSLNKKEVFLEPSIDWLWLIPKIASDTPSKLEDKTASGTDTSEPEISDVPGRNASDSLLFKQAQTQAETCNASECVNISTPQTTEDTTAPLEENASKTESWHKNNNPFLDKPIDLQGN